MSIKRYIIAMLLLVVSIAVFHEYKELKEFTDINLMNQMTATSSNINHSMDRIGACLEYIETSEENENIVPRVVDVLTNEAVDIRDSYFGVITIRGVNKHFKIHYGGFPVGIKRLAQKIELSNELTDDDIADIKKLSAIQLKTSEDEFYKSNSIFFSNKPQDWLLEQYDGLEVLGLTIGQE